MENDLRIIKTKRAIENAMLSLLEIMPFSKVRIINIAEKAMVNRNTIYLHYTSKEEIVMSIINRQFTDNLTELDAEKLFSQRPNSRFATKNAFIKVLNIINSNVDLYRIVLMDSGLSGYLNIDISRIKEAIYSKLKPTKKNLLGVEYIVNGVYGVISRWIIYATATTEEVADLLTDFTRSEMRRLSKI